MKKYKLTYKISLFNEPFNFTFKTKSLEIVTNVYLENSDLDIDDKDVIVINNVKIFCRYGFQLIVDKDVSILNIKGANNGKSTDYYPRA